MAQDTLHNTSAAELLAQLEREQTTLAKLRFDLADRKLKRTSDIPKTRRSIARIKTALSLNKKIINN